MDKMNIAALLDKHFSLHGNWQGLRLGQIVVVWIAYILSEGDHRLNSVQGWVAGMLMTLTICLKAEGLRELDFSDDRLAIVLNRLGSPYKPMQFLIYQQVSRGANNKNRQLKV
jgi:transposase